MFDFENKSDEEVAEYIQSKDQEAYSIIVDRYQAKLMRYVQSITHDKDKASDIVQETFIKAFINLRSFNNKKKFSSWIYRIAHNEALNSVKKNRHEVSIDEGTDFPSTEDLVGDFEKSEVASMLDKCIHRMPTIYSAPLVLYSIEDKTYEEISDILRIPMGTVATRISRAKLLMKNICHKN